MLTNELIAKRILETIPPFMHRLRSEVKSATTADLTVPQLRILAKIKRGITTIGELADAQGISQPAMSRMVETLFKRGLIERTPDLLDKRQSHLKLNQAGETLYANVEANLFARLSRTLEVLADADKQRLLEGLDQISVFFKEMEIESHE